MSKAIQASNTSRRAMLAGLVTLSMAGSVQAMARPDARLISLCYEFTTIRHQLNQSFDLRPDEEGYEAALLGLDDLCGREGEILEEISGLSAVTLYGLKAKAQVVEAYLPDHIADSQVETEQPEVQVVLSLLQDIAIFAAEVRA